MSTNQGPSRPRTHLLRYQSERLKDPAIAKHSSGIDVFRDARRVLEGWSTGALRMETVDGNSKQVPAIVCEIHPMVSSRGGLEDVVKHLGNTLKQYELGGDFRLSVQITKLQYNEPVTSDKPAYRCRFLLIPGDESRAKAAHDAIKKQLPNLLGTLQEQCHMPDAIGACRVH